MATCPRLIIIAEHQACVNTSDWLKRIECYTTLLVAYPKVALQLRAKNRPDLIEKACSLFASCSQVFVNTTIQHAHDLKIQSLHLPQNDIPQTPPPFSFGVSVHKPEDVLTYSHLKPLYYQFGPIFDPLSKGGKGQGYTPLSQALQLSSIPIVAVGGITPDKARSLFTLGCAGVASIGYMMTHHEPKSAIEEFLAACTP